MDSRDALSLRDEFSAQVELASWIYRSYSGRSGGSDQVSTDRAVARWSLFLHLRDFAEQDPSTRQLLDELQRLKLSGEPGPVAHIHRVDDYESARLAILRHLLVRFEESLGPQKKAG